MTTQQTSNILNQRLHGLDALRAFALLLGVLLHATMSFLPNAEYFWLTQDQERSQVLAAIFFSIHVFRMPLFFLLAGFFAQIMLEKRGTSAFVKDRLRRIALPLLIGWPVIFSALVAAIIYAAWVKHYGSLPKNPPPGPSYTPNDFPLIHLWFLYVLVLLYALALAIRGVLNAYHLTHHLFKVNARLMAVLGSWLAPFLLAIPVAVALYYSPYWMQWFGVPTPDRSLYPSVAAWVSFGMAFGFGWMLGLERAPLAHWQKNWAWYLFLSLMLITVCLRQVGIAPLLMPAPHNFAKFGYAWLYVSAAWSTCFALVGMALHFFGTYRASLRYLADASYWIYLIHIPLVVALQAWVSKKDLDWLPKISFVLLVTVGIALFTYHFLVRFTWLGKMLNGPRERQPKLVAESQTI